MPSSFSKKYYSEPKGSLSDSQRGLFTDGTFFRRGAAPFREMMINRPMSSGPNAKRSFSVKKYHDIRYMELPKNYQGYGRHRTKNGVFTKNTWRIFNRAKGGTVAFAKLKNLKEMVLQMEIAAHQLPIAFEHWRFVLAQRALKVFQESIELKCFNSATGYKWQAISKWTRRKRKRAGTWCGAGGLMQETNNLYKSLQCYETIAPFTSGVRANASYAGYHNSPRKGETYGDGFGKMFSPPKPVIRRQFMGHSSLIMDFINAYQKSYLFDTVFRKPTEVVK